MLFDLVWRIFINMSKELLPIYLANMFAEGFFEPVIKVYGT